MKNLKKINSNDSYILIDGMNLFYRIFHSYKKLTNSKGFPVGSVFGIIKTLSILNENFNSNKFIFFWDSNNRTWRKKENSDYKSTRDNNFTDEEKERFYLSMESVYKLLNSFGFIQVSKNGFEADDLIYHVFSKFKNNVIIVSGDKDFLQLVDDKNNVTVARPEKGEYVKYNEKVVLDKFGVKSNQVANYLSLAGDSSDNVKGVNRIGDKKAKKLINSGMITKDKIKDVLSKEQLQEFIKSFKLVKMKGILDDKVKVEIGDCTNLDKGINEELINDIFNEYEFKKFNLFNTKHLFNSSFKNEFKEKVLGEN